MEIAAFILAALSAAWTAWSGYQNRKTAESHQRAVTALEEGKLDLSVAELGHDILTDLITTLREEVRACDEDRERLKKILVKEGLLPWG